VTVSKSGVANLMMNAGIIGNAIAIASCHAL
jgi:hypothetical protein